MSLRDGLIAEYLLTGDARDTSGREHHGVVHGATPVADRFGRPNSAFHFDGIGDYIEVSPPPALNPAAVSVSIWACFDPRPLHGWTNCLIAQDNGNDDDQSNRVFQISAFHHHVVWHRMIGARDPECKRRIDFGPWHHVVATFAAGTHTLFVDGVMHDSVEHAFRTSATQPLHIGRKGSNEPFFFFRGSLDDVRIYDRALSAGEVASLYHENGFAPEPPSPRFSHGDPISGRWGQNGVLFLDLAFDGSDRVTGRVMNGRPGVYAPIGTGAFDRATGVVLLTGEAAEHKSGVMHPYEIRGMLDDGEVTVSAFFGGWSGNLSFTRNGARWPWRHALARGINRFVRRVLGLPVHGRE